MRLRLGWDCGKVSRVGRVVKTYGTMFGPGLVRIGRVGEMGKRKDTFPD